MSGNTLFFLLRDMNLVCKKNIDTETMELYPGIPEGSIFTAQMASQIVIWGKELIFIPKKAKSIWISDWEMQNWEKVEYEEVPKGCYAEYVALQAFFNEDKLFIIGSDYPAIMCLTSDRRLTYIREPYQRFLPRMDEMRELFFRKDYVKKGNLVYLASCRDNFVLKLWLDTYEYEWVEIGTKGNTYSGITLDGETFWLAPRRYPSPIVKWDGKENAEEFVLPDSLKVTRHPFLGIANTKDGLFLPGKDQTTSILISRQGEIKTVEGQYFFYKRIKNQEFLTQDTDGRMCHILQNGTVNKIPCTMEREDFLRLFKWNVDDFRILFQEPRSEDCLIQLKEMIRMLVNSDVSSPLLKSTGNGQKIWMFLRKEG